MTKLLLIIVIQLIYVPMLTLRTICMVKNLKMLTGFFGFAESLIYIFGLAVVLSGQQSVVEMIVYAAGFSMGLVAGIYVEQRMAIGFSGFEVNINHENPEFLQLLREQGFGVTVFEGYGISGKRIKLDILTRRKREKELIRYIEEYEPGAYVVSYEPRIIRGGYLADVIRKRINMRVRPKLPKMEKQRNFLKKHTDKLISEIRVLKKFWKNI